jgi:hypothetical protein
LLGVVLVRVPSYGEILVHWTFIVEAYIALMFQVEVFWGVGCCGRILTFQMFTFFFKEGVGYMSKIRKEVRH